MVFPDVLLLILSSLPGDELDDRELARRIREGDEKAFRQFFERYHTPLYRYVRSKSVSPDVAEDLVQKAFVRIWERREEIDPDKSLRAYLFRIGHTRALNHFRDTSKFSYEVDFTRMQGAAKPDAGADHEELHEALHQAIAELPERRRAVFELCFLHNLTYRETAQALDISVKTVENQMSRALKSLREALAVFRE